jgi:hypothetical protein
MPCRWHDKQIVVLETVIIAEPYGNADVKGNDQKAVKRVKQVVCTPFLLPPRGFANSCSSRVRDGSWRVSVGP